MNIVCNSAQLAQFAADPDWTDAAIPTAAKFTAWNDGNYSGWILKSHVGTFKITGYDSAKMELTIRKMKFSERITLWLETNLTLWRFGKSLVRKIVNILKSLPSLYSDRERRSAPAKQSCT